MSLAAVAYRWAPVRSEPVNAIFRTRGCSTSGCPASGPNPVTTFTTPLGEPRPLDQLDELQRGGRGVLRGLEHHGVAGRESGSELPCDQHQRGVPRDDADAHPERLVPGEREGRLVGVHDRPLDLVREPGVVVVDARDVAKLGGHLAQQLAVVAHLQLAEALGVLGHEVREAAHERTALRRVHPAPLRGLERPLGRLHGAVRILRVASRHERPRPGGVGVVALEILARRRLDELAVDVHVQLLEGFWDGHRACHRVRSPVSRCRKGKGACPRGGQHRLS